MSRAFEQSKLRFKRISLVVLLGLPAVVHAQQSGVNQYSCGPVVTGYGPFDYRTITEEVRHRVEDYHFTPDVETLRNGNSSSVGGDLDYTLRAFPNSPRALLSMSRLATRLKTEKPAGARYVAECYFFRAIRFVPNDPMPHVLYAAYLKERRRNAEAKVQLDAADTLRGEPMDSDIDYNLGLLYFDLGSYDKALQAAKRAYALGASLPALKSKLRAAGKWQD